jgi:aspartate/methionine/tyrosine aminotransferase
MMESFARRRDLIVDGLNRLDGISALRPGGAFYVWPNISGLCAMTGCSNAEQMRRRWLVEAGVAVLADSQFGAPVPGEDQHVRFSYATAETRIVEGLERLADWIRRARR